MLASSLNLTSTVSALVASAIFCVPTLAQTTSYQMTGESGFMQDLDANDGFDYFTETQGTWRAKFAVPGPSGFTFFSNTQNQGGSLTRYTGSILEELVLTFPSGDRTIVSSPVNGQITLWDRASFRGGTDYYELNFQVGSTRITFQVTAVRNSDTAWDQLFIRGTPNANTPDNDFIPLFADTTARDVAYFSTSIAIDGFTPEMPGRGRYNGSISTFTPAGGGGCDADFNGDNSADFFDYLDFVAAFDANDPSADFNGDSSIDFFDYLDFVAAFDLGC
jgi:hypothetical protein